MNLQYDTRFDSRVLVKLTPLNQMRRRINICQYRFRVRSVRLEKMGYDSRRESITSSLKVAKLDIRLSV